MVETESLLVLHEVAPTHPQLLPSKVGYMKVRLTFLTSDPKHIRSVMLREQYRAEPPYLEDVCILLPLKETFSILETFIPAFEKLRESRVVSSTAKLLKFKILDDDLNTLAYLFE